jgi:predicted metal-dependent phosphoesterase TrpH
MIDLHTHSTRSDGSLAPRALIDLAAEQGLVAVALTDHDTLSGIPEARDRAKERGIRFIPGVELEIETAAGLGTEAEFHLLGLRFEGDVAGLSRALEDLRTARRERNLKMIQKLNEGGFDVTIGELEAMASGDVVSRAHFARLLASKGIVSSISQAFSRYLGKGRPFYVQRRCLSLSDAVALIREAGGIASIAHPLSLALKGPALRQFLSHCRDIGVSAIEAYHPGNTVRGCRKLEHMGRALGLSITGGSDFHGGNIPQRKLGYTAGEREIPDRFLDALR